MRVTVSDDQLVVQLTKRESIYAMRQRLTVPKSSISTIEWLDEFRDWRTYEFRAPGSYLPGVIIAGSFYSPQGWDFVYASKPNGWTRPLLKDVLVITTSKRRFKRIILKLHEDEAKRIIAWLKK